MLTKNAYKKYSCNGQLSIFDFMARTEPDKNVPRLQPVWKRYPAANIGYCPKCNTEIYYDGTYKGGDKFWNPINHDYNGQKICPKCLIEFPDAEFPSKDYANYPLISGLDDKPIKDFEPNQKAKIKHPDYGGSQDEIVRLTIENQFELGIILKTCDCGSVPKGYFRSNTEYWVQCECGRKTDIYKHMYEAKQWWNIGKLAANICPHSNHECNKKELWKIADGLDETQCPHICCRKCATRNCGARCNGSNEPPRVRLWHRMCSVKPTESGNYEIMDINGNKSKAWFEASRGDFDHVTGYQIECWREN